MRGKPSPCRRNGLFSSFTSQSGASVVAGFATGAFTAAFDVVAETAAARGAAFAGATTGAGAGSGVVGFEGGVASSVLAFSSVTGGAGVGADAGVVKGAVGACAPAARLIKKLAATVAVVMQVVAFDEASVLVAQKFKNCDNRRFPNQLHQPIA